MEIQVGPVSIEINSNFAVCRGKPIGEDVELDGKRLLAYMRTPDGGDIHVGFTEWANGKADVVGLAKVSGPDVYDRLTRAGRMQVASTSSGENSARLQALRYKAPGHATLASITWDDLNKLLGSNVSELLKSYGAVELGNAGDILGVTNNTRNQLAMIFPRNNHEALFAAYALTRVLPLMKNYGISQVSAI